MRHEGFGENYVQEGCEKIEYFKKQHPDLEITWHFIGHLQSNKTRPVAEHFRLGSDGRPLKNRTAAF